MLGPYPTLTTVTTRSDIYTTTRGPYAISLLNGPPSYREEAPTDTPPQYASPHSTPRSTETPPRYASPPPPYSARGYADRGDTPRTPRTDTEVSLRNERSTTTSNVNTPRGSIVTTILSDTERSPSTDLNSPRDSLCTTNLDESAGVGSLATTQLSERSPQGSQTDIPRENTETAEPTPGPSNEITDDTPKDSGSPDGNSVEGTTVRESDQNVDSAESDSQPTEQQDNVDNNEGPATSENTNRTSIIHSPRENTDNTTPSNITEIAD